jgi:hypothetical protein
VSADIGKYSSRGSQITFSVIYGWDPDCNKQGLAWYKALVVNDESLIYHQGFALINALAWAKVVLVREFI